MIFSFEESIIIIIIAALTTFLTRAIPFIFFRSGKCPKTITALGYILPPAMISVLIIYSIKDSHYTNSYFIPELLCIALVAILQLWKKNVLLSVGVGTICYMLLIQFVF